MKKCLSKFRSEKLDREAVNYENEAIKNTVRTLEIAIIIGSVAAIKKPRAALAAVPYSIIIAIADKRIKK